MPYTVDKETGLIVFHGTSQDKMSRNENTVKIFDIAKTAGWRVEELGGPGSVERAMKTVIRADPGVLDYTPINEMGLPLDYAYGLTAGVAWGSGVEDNILEGLEMIRKLEMDGARRIKMIGFSRGAVTVVNVLEQMTREKRRPRVPISITLLDPVPGPLRSRRGVIPEFVDDVQLFVSQHEGRPGFAPLDISVSARTRLHAQVATGVHGDVGGSTGSDVSSLVLDDVLRHHRIPGVRLTAEQRVEQILRTMEDPSRYVMPTLEHAIWPRSIRPVTGVGMLDASSLMFPYASTVTELMSRSEVLRSARSGRDLLDGAFARSGVDTRIMKIIAEKAKLNKFAEQRAEHEKRAAMEAQRREAERAQERAQAWLQRQEQRALQAQAAREFQQRAQAMRLEAERRAQEAAAAEAFRLQMVFPQPSFRNTTTGAIVHPPPMPFRVNTAWLRNLAKFIPRFPKG